MRLGLDLNRRRLSWLPAALFRSAEAGAWFDASDLTTLFQDSAGTTPVTTAGQPVGLWLDKSLAGNHARQATAGLRPLRRRFPAGGVRNLIDNTPFAGAVSGTPGTGPTSWTRFNSLGTITAATDTLRVSCAAARDQFGQVYAASAATNYIMSALVTVNSGTTTVQNTIDFPAPLAGATVTWQIDGVTVAGSTAVSVGAHTVAALIAVAGTAGNINARIGVGVNGNVTADVTFTAPQLEVGTARSVYQTRVSVNDVTEAGQRDIPALRHDLVDDALVVTLPNLGTNATVIWGQADGAHFLTAQTISGATTLPQVADLTGVTYVNRALTAAETSRMTAYYNRRAGL